MTDRAEIWRAVHDERKALLEDLQGVTDEGWRTPSMCPGWSVHDVLAHLVDSATTTRRGFARQMLRARFDFDRANEDGIRRHRALSPRATLEAFGAVVDRTDTPPGPLATRLVEAYVHGEDVRRPLGIAAGYPVEHVVTALRYVVRTGAAFGGGRERVRGLRLVATDVPLSIGEGSSVQGPAMPLLLAASGRPVRDEELVGPGVGQLVGC